jgi:hypothetical protein
MFFIYPMWDNESQRIGKMKCSKVAYSLHGIADYIGLLGLVFLIGISIAKVLYGSSVSWWYFSIPFIVSLIGWFVLQLSWLLVIRRGFKYDYDEREASWIENGVRITFKFKP